MSDVTGGDVICKMRVTEKSDKAWGSGPERTQSTVKLQPVYANEGPNKTWSDATPSGQIELNITNRLAFDRFELGKCYLVMFKQTTED